MVRENVPRTGINDLWYVALSWEFGVDEEPWIHLEDDYGYQFDDSEQVMYDEGENGDDLNIQAKDIGFRLGLCLER